VLDRDHNAALNILNKALEEHDRTGGTRKRAGRTPCITLLDRPPLLVLHTSGKRASGLDERRTPAHSCRGVSGEVFLRIALRNTPIKHVGIGLALDLYVFRIKVLFIDYPWNRHKERVLLVPFQFTGFDLHPLQ
jgi:hypothetical protein